MKAQEVVFYRQGNGGSLPTYHVSGITKGQRVLIGNGWEWVQGGGRSCGWVTKSRIAYDNAHRRLSALSIPYRDEGLIYN